ncbi:MAG TPA: hypothetical protein VM680_01335 [Verrucomicrobiae bacterium]|nr:hypothetical protein [Verrucomicrobiae bacterium]
MKSIWRISLCVVLSVVGVVRAADPKLELTHSGAEATVKLSGDAGKEYLIESARGSADVWTPVTSFILSDPSRLWKDAAANGGNRFFRARSKAAGEAEYASDFRLIDQNGVSRDLYYYATLGTLKAIVLTFTDGNYGAFAPKIAALKSAFPNNVFFWTIDTRETVARTNIVKEAAAAGINWPVYHDPAQLVTFNYGAHFNGEVVVIDRETLSVKYRGVIDDAAGNYARQALDSLVSGTSALTTRLEPQQGEIAARARVTADYATVIAPLLQTKCVICHSPGNIGPFALTKYDDVVEHSDHMKEEVLAKRMPPWHADSEFGKFHNDISLSKTELAQLVDWIDAGTPRGTGTDPLTNVPPAPPKWPVELGEPDQIVKVPVQQIAATGTLAYRYIYVNATNATDKWLKAAVVRPSNRAVVHHYIVWTGHSSSAMLSGIAAYAPGRTDKPFPEGTGVLLPANSPLTFNLHYTAHGTAEVDEPELALWYADAPPAKELKTVASINYLFTLKSPGSEIPAGNPDYQLTANAYLINNQPTLGALTFSTPVRLYSFQPHMHFRGLRMRFELTLPGSSTKQTLLSVPKYDFDWQTMYTLETPLDLPAGARIDVVGAFDNSAQNIYNPDPTIPVKWGEQSWEEMFIGYIEYSER